MGDPHHNTWGGKNNSWGNKNRKPKSNNNNQRPNKLFNALAGGVCLFLLGALGLDLVSAAITKISDVKDTYDTAKEVAEQVKEKSDSSSNGKKSKVKFDIENEIDISAEDVNDILEYLTDLHDNDGGVVGEDVVIVDYSAFANLEDYQLEVVDKLYNFDKNVTFVAVNKDDFINQNDVQEELDRVKEMLYNNINLIDGAGFGNVQVSAQYNSPYAYQLTLVITYIKE